MFNKFLLLNQITKSLVEKGYKTFITQGCFDVAARRECLLLLKTLINIDGLTRKQALSLRTIAYFLSAYPLVISIKNNKYKLDDNVIYSRFSLPVLTPKLFDSVITEEISVIQSAKGRHTVEIDVVTLREKRKELNYTIEELAKLIGISKKALYEIENKRVLPSIKTVKKLENELKVNLRMPYSIQHPKPAHLEPKNKFQKEVSREFTRIGIDNSPVYSAPFELVGKERFSMIAGLSENVKQIRHEVSVVKELSSIFLSHAIFISKDCRERSLEGIPIISMSELAEIKSSRELNKIIAEKI